jgi:hypothetical protein
MLTKKKYNPKRAAHKVATSRTPSSSNIFNPLKVVDPIEQKRNIHRIMEDNFSLAKLISLSLTKKISLKYLKHFELEA